MNSKNSKNTTTEDQMYRRQKSVMDIGIIGILSMYMITNNLYNFYNIILLLLISSICFIPYIFGNKTNNRFNNVYKCFTFSLQLSFLAILPYKGEPFIQTTLMFIGLSVITTVLYFTLSHIFRKIYIKKS